ncbi:hypothetical protein FB45DRAFT_750328, partial [Roridomyces roridus]
VSNTLPVFKSNSLLAANFETFTQRTLSVSLPSDLGLIHPMTEFVELLKARLAPMTPNPSFNSSVSTGVITPACLQVLYNIPATPQTTHALLVMGYQQQLAQQAGSDGE